MKKVITSLLFAFIATIASAAACGFVYTPEKNTPDTPQKCPLEDSKIETPKCPKECQKSCKAKPGEICTCELKTEKTPKSDQNPKDGICSKKT